MSDMITCYDCLRTLESHYFLEIWNVNEEHMVFENKKAINVNVFTSVFYEKVLSYNSHLMFL